jgi:hypothetical protein
MSNTISLLKISFFYLTYLKHCKTLQNAPRDEGKLREFLKLKEKENEQATHIEDTQRLVTEIEMLKVILYLIKTRKYEKS